MSILKTSQKKKLPLHLTNADVVHHGCSFKVHSAAVGSGTTMQENLSINR